MSKYAVFFTLKGEAIARAMDQPSDRVLVVSKAVESAGGKLEAYYLMFGQYDGFVIVDLPDSRAAAATSLAVSSTGAFEHLETHELIEAEDLNPILEQAKGISPAPSAKPGSAQPTQFPERPESRSPFARAYSKALIGSELPDPSAQAPAQHTAGRAGWCWLLALQRPHVGGLGTLGSRGHVELDGLALIK
jgi:uncharacterized protein with GYD domain